MQAGAKSLGQVFAPDQQNIIPHFQRPYVWDAERNWQPLWEDIREAAEEVESEASVPLLKSETRTYFLGAMVLQHRPKPPQRVFLWNVIDGQQRLTTLQVLVGAARGVAMSIGATSLAANFASMIENQTQALHPQYPDDRYKLWPLPQDRPAFLWAVSTESGAIPSPDPKHRISQARSWFERTVRDWALESQDAETRLYYLIETLRNRMQLVQIELEASDDPQVIFEVLNYRGVPLDAVDLVKNLLFQQLEHGGKSAQADSLLTHVWAPLDREPWRDEVSRGRLLRKRADILLSYWLTIEQGKEVPVEHLFSDFKTWLQGSDCDAADVIRSIRHYADRMEAMRALPLSDPIGQVLDRLEASQTTTPWPVLLYVFANDQVPPAQRHVAAKAIDSFIMRRQVCRMTTKDYNHLFVSVLAAAKAADPASAGDAVIQSLLAQESDSRRWPTDEEFDHMLAVDNLYHVVTRARLRSLLLALDLQMRTDKTDPGAALSYADGSLSIEHILPQKWETNWPLALQPGDEGYEEALDRRWRSVHRLGNLTIMTSRLNSAQSNRAWPDKKQELQKHGLLRITTGSVLSAPESIPHSVEVTWADDWNEDRIEVRGTYLRELALKVWRRPAT